MKQYVPLAAASAGALAAGGVAQLAGIPGGLIFGAVIGAALVTLAYGRRIEVPKPLRTAIMIGIGALIGMGVTRETLSALRQAVVPAIGTAVLLILAGLLIALVLRWWGRSPDGDFLATSPGALEVLIGLAGDEGYDAVQVAMFHLVRIVLVVLLLPAILTISTGV
jgi:uncharacterized protein